MRNIILALTALASLATTPSFASTMLDDVADISVYAPKSMPDARVIQLARNDHRFTAGGAKYVSSLHLLAAPQSTDKGRLYQAAALMSDASGRLFYRFFNITMGKLVPIVTTIDVVKEVNLADTHFSIYTGLEDRLTLVEDEANGLAFAFPLGVGGIDENVMGEGYRILTPKFHGATLQRATVNPARTDPAYYRGHPFMPITTAKGSVTAIAFHITILGDEEANQYGLNYLQRGFESHGCMRMRDKDLSELFTIVMKGGSDKLPVTVDTHVWNKNAEGVRDASAGAADIVTAYPVETDSYMRVTYFPEAPHYKRDDIPNEHLVMMDRARGQPDLRKLDQILSPAMDEIGVTEEDADLKFSKYDMP